VKKKREVYEEPVDAKERKTGSKYIHGHENTKTEVKDMLVGGREPNVGKAVP